MTRAKIPLRCLGCGNVVLALRSDFEDGLTEIAANWCPACDDGRGEEMEIFYGTKEYGLVDYGQLMDRRGE